MPRRVFHVGVHSGRDPRPQSAAACASFSLSSHPRRGMASSFLRCAWSRVGLSRLRRPRPASAAGRRSMRVAWSVASLASGPRAGRGAWRKPFDRLGLPECAILVPRRPRADAPSDAWRDRSRDERRAGHWECRPAAGTMNAAAPSRRPELTPAADREVRSACGYPLVVTDDPSEAESSRRIDRTIRIGSMHEADPDRDHWLTRSPAERLAALEACREAFYGTDAVRRGLARVLEIARQE
jgi:hypothetical protein